MPQSFTTRPEIRGTFGAVTSTHWIASTVGFGILEKGGNAVDAAVATGFTLQIVEPHLNGPGGEVPIILHLAGEDRPRVLCGQGTAPAAATIDAVRAMGYDRMPGMGLAPAVVPGSFGAWMRLLLEHGTMRLRDVLEPAIFYARNGYPLPHRAAESIHAIAQLFRSDWHHSAEVWLPGDAAPMPGQRVAQPQIADAYDRILSEAEAAAGDRDAQIEAARHAWYQGFVADAVDGFYGGEQADGAGNLVRGLLTGQDMAGWQASWEDTVSTRFRDVDVHKTGPWGQGPAMLIALGILDALDIGSVDPGSTEWVHLTVEALKRGLADRDAYFGDPDHVDVPLETLLSKDYIAAHAAAIGAEASQTLTPGDPRGDGQDRGALLAELAATPEAAAQGVGEPTFADLPEIEGDTCHLDVVDRWGNLVSATPSGGWLQSAPAVPGLGFNITTRGQMFWLDDRLPSHLAPGRRPRTTLTPTVITRDGKPLVGLGSPGGDQQDQWALGLILRHLVQGLNLQAAIDAPLFHTGHYVNSFAPRHFTPAALHIEDRFDAAILTELRERGHAVNEQPSWSLGRLCAAGFRSDGMIRAAATPRFMQAYAVGR
ncbi:MAG: gamma-glutamyltransferase family protein [Pseudomonadota bacterium]